MMRRPFTTRPEILGTYGVVTSTHWLATASGMAILEQGGNAFDAAVATGFVLQVVEPHLNGLLGEVTMLLGRERDGNVDVLCGQGVAPAAATIDHYRSLGLDLVPGSGLLAAVVPGAFDAWMLLLRNYGRLSLEEVLTPAIRFAEHGYPLVPNISSTIASVRELFEAEWKTSAALYLPNGSVPTPGTLFRNPALVATYRKLLAEARGAGEDRSRQIEAARNAFRRGFVAEAIDDFCRCTEAMDSTGERHGALLTGDDLAAWQATLEPPLTYDYRNFTVCKTDMWGQGPVFLQQLALLKGFDLDSMAPEGADFIHVITECSKLAFADREAFYGDPVFVAVPRASLLADSYSDRRRRLIEDTASLELRPGAIPGFDYLPTLRIRQTKAVLAAANKGLGEPTVARFEDVAAERLGALRGDTCHLDIVDRDGNMISATPSGGWLQSSPVIPDLGACLGNRAQMFSLDPNAPSCLGPRRRPRTTLTPSLALRDGVPYMVFGTPGGDQQDQWSLHFFLRHVHHGLNLQEAIECVGFHTAHFPTSFYPRDCDPGHLAVEGRIHPDDLAALHRRGHRIEVDEDWSIGRMAAACKDGYVLKAAANPRFMQGYAIGR